MPSGCALVPFGAGEPRWESTSHANDACAESLSDDTRLGSPEKTSRRPAANLARYWAAGLDAYGADIGQPQRQREKTAVLCRPVPG